MNRPKRTLLVCLGIVWEWLIIPLAVIYISICLNKKLPYFLLAMPADPFLTAAFVGLGIFWTVSSYLELTNCGRGTIIPFCDPTQKLVTGGVYRYCRNPMYLGYILLLIGFSIYAHSLIILILGLAGTAFFFICYIKPVEEKALLRKFGKEYLKYRTETPFLIPLRLSLRKAGGLRKFFLIHLVLVAASVFFFASQVFGFINTRKNILAETGERLHSIPDLPEIKKDERILVLAPHPDDEVLGNAGLIQKALAAGAKVKIVFLTNGDHDQIAFKIDARRIILPPREYIVMGEQRRQESIKAAAFLGLRRADLIFLGYPDSGTLEIWKERWKNAEPFRNRLTHARAVPYQDDFSFGAPYKGESILNDLTKILDEYQPNAVFVTAPLDTNVDHQASFCFLSAAVLQFSQKNPEPKVYLYLIHQGAWPRPYHFHPKFALFPPKKLLNGEFVCYKHLLTPEETRKKYRTILLFKSILKGRAYLWTSFARRNELFADARVFKVERSAAESPDWDEGSRISNIGISEAENSTELNPDLKGISYLKSDSNLLIDIFITKKLSVKNGVSLYLFGFRKDIPFGEMPKVRITVQPFSRVAVYDGMHKIKTRKVKLTATEKELFFELPLELLGEPEIIFASARVHRGELSLDATSWHLLKMEQKTEAER